MSDDVTSGSVAQSYREAADLDAEAAKVLAAEDTSAEKAAFAANPLDTLCALWRRIRVIVVGASNLFFIPGNIRAVLKKLITVLDGICPS